MYTPNVEDFYWLLGKTLELCQRIERDVKMIYAAMSDGDYEENYRQIERETLGKTVFYMEEIDGKDGFSEFSAESYATLKAITGERNHFVHSCFLSFDGLTGDAQTEAFMKEYKRLERFGDRLGKLYENIAMARVDILDMGGEEEN